MYVQFEREEKRFSKFFTPFVQNVYSAPFFFANKRRDKKIDKERIKKPAKERRYYSPPPLIIVFYPNCLPFLCLCVTPLLWSIIHGVHFFPLAKLALRNLQSAYWVNAYTIIRVLITALPASFLLPYKERDIFSTPRCIRFRARKVLIAVATFLPFNCDCTALSVYL